jgi:glucokinase
LQARACFGVPGPVVRGTVIATNLPWKITERSLKRLLSVSHLSLLNDLVAHAYGIALLKSRDFVVLNQGRAMNGNAALLSAGTGLGTAVLFRHSTGLCPSPSEGGHVEFGPRNSLERELLEYLAGRFGHVSYERLLSGPGLGNIYQFLRDSGRLGKEPAWLAERMELEDPAAVITESARLKKCALCEKTLDVFTSIYGSAAGSLALQVMATAGVYIGGGIAPKIIAQLKQGRFMKAFTDKGRLSRIVERIPVKVIMNDRTALLGAAHYAAR